MKKILISSSGKLYNSVIRLQEELKNLGYESDILFPKEFYIKFDQNVLEMNHRDGFNWGDYSYIIPRSPKDLNRFLFVLNILANKNNVHVLNERNTLEDKGSYNKFFEYFYLSTKDVPLIPTILPGNDELFEEDVDRLGLIFPMVAKCIVGSRGGSVHIVNGIEDINNLVKLYGRGKLMLQKYIKSNHDLRIIVLDNKVLGVMKRSSSNGDFRNNYSLGGEVNAFELNDDIESISLKCAKGLSLDYCGVDLINDEGQYRILEVNEFPQFEGFEKSTGVNVAKALAEFAIKSIS